MEIVYFGQSCFRIRAKEATIVTDPFHTTEYLSLKPPKLEADIITVSHSHEDHNNVESVSGTVNRPKPFIIDAPGEYEVSGVSVFGFGAYHDKQQGKERGKNNIFIIVADGLRLVHLGDLGQKLDEKLKEEVSEPDVLFVPVGGKVTLDSSEAVDLVSQLQPKIVIPMHYRLPGGNAELDPVENFMKEIGLEQFEQVEKLSVNLDKLPEEREIVVLAKRA